MKLKGSKKLSEEDLRAIDLLCRQSLKKYLQGLSPEKLKELLISSTFSKDEPLPKHLRLENLVANQYQEQRFNVGATKKPKLKAAAPMSVAQCHGNKSLQLLKTRCSGQPLAQPSDFLFLTSHLRTKSDVAAVEGFAAKWKIRITSEYQRGVTHLFMTSVRRRDAEPPRGPNDVGEIDGRLARRTAKLFQAVAGKAFIMSAQYAHQCLESNDILAEEKHEMLGDEGLSYCGGLQASRCDPNGVFDGWRIVCQTYYDGFSHEEMCELLRSAGAQVFDDVADVREVDRRCVLIGSLGIGISYNEMFRRTGLPSVDREWVFDSILAHKVQPITDVYLLCDVELLSSQRRIAAKHRRENKPLPYHRRLENLVAHEYQNQRCMVDFMKQPNVSAPQPDAPDDIGGNAIAVKEKGSHSKRGLKRLVTVESGYLPSAKPVADYGCKWPGCKTRRASQASLRRHNNVYLETFKCTVCSKCYESPSQLRRHYVCHDTVRPFICAICGKDFKIKDHRNDHVKRLHSGEGKPFKCPDCEASAWTRQHIYEHRVVVHGWDWQKYEAK